MNIGVVFVHGMGDTKPSYSMSIRNILRDYIPRDLYQKIVFQEVYYQNILQNNQKRYFNSVKRRLRWEEMRKFMLYGFSDAASLESQKEGKNSPYYLAQKEIQTCFKSLHGRIHETAPVIVIAQSLGGQVFSNYLWDANKQDENGVSCLASQGVWSKKSKLKRDVDMFCRGSRISKLFTTGCNIPLFVAGRDEADIKPINPPNENFKWHNYYDKDDVLGWPLEQLSDAYSNLVKDKQINAGGLIGLTPMSHVNYWQDRDFLRPLARDIKKLAIAPAV